VNHVSFTSVRFLLAASAAELPVGIAWFWCWDPIQIYRSFSTSCPFFVFSSCFSSPPVDSSPLEGQKRTTQKLAPAQALASPDGGWSRRNPLWAALNQKNGVSY
jgi:hypothetical protein